MAEANKDDYLLSRGYWSSTRLNLHFYLWRDAMGYLLHPSIPNAAEEWRVADVAAGTGLWLVKVSQLAPPSSQFDGYDISPAQFPAKSLTPRNVDLKILDAKTEPPRELWGRYDVVHVRLLVAVVDDGDPTPVLEHCLRLLRGYLQWDEVDTAAIYESKDISATAPCLSTIAKLWATTKPSAWIGRLEEIFQKTGFEQVEKTVHTDLEWQRHMMMELWCAIAEEHAGSLEQAQMHQKADGLRGLATGAYREIKEGAFYEHRLQVVVGRKPL